MLTCMSAWVPVLFVPPDSVLGGSAPHWLTAVLRLRIVCRFGSTPTKKNQYLLDETTETGFPAPVVEQVVAGPQLFQYLPSPGRSRRRLLLNGISSAGRGQQPQLEGA
jgi:hypothetical protein